jgi:hypothetical protein
VGLERGPLSLVSTIEELLGKKSSGSGLKNREYGFRDPSRWPRCSLYRQNLELTSTTSGGLSVGIVRSRAQATEFSFSSFRDFHYNYYKKIIRCSAVGIATAYELNDRRIGIRYSVGSRIFTSPYSPHLLWGPPSLLSTGTWGYFTASKAAGAWSWPLYSN